MEWLFVTALGVVMLFGLVVLFGAPYLPTLKPQTDVALDLLDLKPGDTLLELGSGDGRVLKAAARQGLNAVGYELNPLLVVISKLHTWPYRSQISIKWANYWRQPWPPAEGIYTFLLPKYMQKLDKKITQEFISKSKLEAPLKVVSFAFPIPRKEAEKQLSGLYLYKY